MVLLRLDRGIDRAIALFIALLSMAGSIRSMTLWCLTLQRFSVPSIRRRYRCLARASRVILTSSVRTLLALATGADQ
jgi:hypothetical protein